METMKPEQRDFARKLRHDLTDAEAKLWHLLRGRRLAYLKFRRQVPIGRYVVDFVCLRYRLIIEADGSQHAESTHDHIRDSWLAAQGFTIVRFWNADILQSPTVVQDTILARAGLPW
ncbi:endonuclease domain-containing protein [Labrys okinawensis]|uniref:Endonuclease domain-containing protein n=2 Tax=Labrys okinawensis TaxID=346911 RepID=A0A2S9Q474_9HYPH|nr:endonuclease domain-containing protein [Labrys okinawensis]